jgi:hypothetical protein
MFPDTSGLRARAHLRVHVTPDAIEIIVFREDLQ